MIHKWYEYYALTGSVFDDLGPVCLLFDREVFDERLDEVVDQEVRVEGGHALAAAGAGQVGAGAAVLPHLNAVLTKFVAAIEHMSLYTKNVWEISVGKQSAAQKSVCKSAGVLCVFCQNGHQMLPF